MPGFDLRFVALPAHLDRSANRDQSGGGKVALAVHAHLMQILEFSCVPATAAKSAQFLQNLCRFRM
jgi:hypothetical protein